MKQNISGRLYLLIVHQRLNITVLFTVLFVQNSNTDLLFGVGDIGDGKKQYFAEEFLLEVPLSDFQDF